MQTVIFLTVPFGSLILAVLKLGFQTRGILLARRAHPPPYLWVESTPITVPLPHNSQTFIFSSLSDIIPQEKETNKMIFELFTNPISFFAWFVALLVAISVHEFSHALAAFKLGDPTAEYEGRLTLNPLAHLDPIGTLMILFVGFGWGKPVPVNPLNFDNPRRDHALVALSGPLSNFAAALILSSLLKLPLGAGGLLLEVFLLPTIILNISLGVFNLLPILPLDGFSVVSGFLPRDLAFKWEELQQYSLYILVFTLLPIFGGRSLIGTVISPIIQFLLNILL